jgi:hypothetical protein
MSARISVSIACLAAAAVLSVGGTSSASTPPPTAVALGAGLSPCPTVVFRGRHQLSQRNMGCGQAKQKAVYVIKRDKAPDGWKCTGRILKGYARCTHGRKVFAISPA